MQIQHPAWRSQPKKSDEEKEERGLGRKRQTALDLYLERFEKRGRQVAPQCLVVSSFLASLQEPLLTIFRAENRSSGVAARHTRVVWFSQLGRHATQLSPVCCIAVSHGRNLGIDTMDHGCTSSYAIK